MNSVQYRGQPDMIKCSFDHVSEWKRTALIQKDANEGVDWDKAQCD